ncbi:PadR family transcriptional regulator [Amycolatopsis taiwanensis]|uniref:Transcription regulator PadR N-terminal domain-containing protein n=1 Tax=Amycolatopsis taiwanensis TaxID=342230 RepID=A0A9W6VGA8_9PSEU|nr:PadR family transcriptional regulator [Amycolatopsis taiwanensis]GLY65754.1 hypothetical protein Atai01_23730 [Amycolatopsis taiwanensis]
MTLRHAVLASLLDEERSGYQLAKAFDVGVANFWHALPQQLYAELSKLEKDGLITGRDVRQANRPAKRLFRPTRAGLDELQRFVAAESRPSVIRDDLLVKVQAADHVDPDPLIERSAPGSPGASAANPRGRPHRQTPPTPAGAVARTDITAHDNTTGTKCVSTRRSRLLWAVHLHCYPHRHASHFETVSRTWLWTAS